MSTVPCACPFHPPLNTTTIYWIAHHTQASDYYGGPCVLYLFVTQLRGSVLSAWPLFTVFYKVSGRSCLNQRTNAKNIKFIGVSFLICLHLVRHVLCNACLLSVETYFFFFFLLFTCMTYLPGALIKTCQGINTSKISVIKDYLNADS